MSRISSRVLCDRPGEDYCRLKQGSNCEEDTSLAANRTRITNQVSGREELVPIDRKTSDAERDKYGVPPLAELLKTFLNKRPQKNLKQQELIPPLPQN